MQALTLERPTTVPPTPAVLWEAMTESLQDEMSTADDAAEISVEDVPKVLGHAPAMPEWIGHLTLPIPPELVRERVEDLGPRIDGAFPERVDVCREQVEDDGCAPDALRGQDARLGELVRHPDRRITEPQLHIHQLATGQHETVAFFGAESGRVPLGSASGVSNDEVGGDGVHPFGDRPDVHVGLLSIGNTEASVPTKIRVPGECYSASRCR